MPTRGRKPDYVDKKSDKLEIKIEGENAAKSRQKKKPNDNNNKRKSDRKRHKNDGDKDLVNDSEPNQQPNPNEIDATEKVITYAEKLQQDSLDAAKRILVTCEDTEEVNFM